MDHGLKRPHPLLHSQNFLGFVIENGRSRWLTDQEISDTVVAAIAAKKTKAVVGLLEPRERRPGY
jgi:hypothetical protein